MHFRTLALAALALAGCSRTFSSPQAAQQNNVTPQINGTRCDTDAGTLCASGVCADGYCCERSCAADQRCNELGHEGVCVDRQFGEPCDAGADCPTNFCRDGVCCESDCSDDCVTCNGKIHPGVCALVDDNTDPRGQCGGACLSCFGGVCGPALLGSNPVNGCADGTGCADDLVCRTTDGGACLQNSECANDSCVVGSCLSPETDVLPLGFVATASQFPIVVDDAAATPSGDEAVVIQDQEALDDGTSLRDSLVLFHHQAGQAWVRDELLILAGTENGGHYGEVVFLGRRIYVVTFGPQGTATPGLTGRQVFDNGLLGPVETIDAASTESGGNAFDAFWMKARVDADGTVVVNYSDRNGFHTRARDLHTGQWANRGDVARPSNYAFDAVAFGQLNGQDVFIYLTQPPNNQDAPNLVAGLAVVGADGSTIAATTEATGFPCGASDGFYDRAFANSSRGTADGTHVHFWLICAINDQSYLGELDASGALTFSQLASANGASSVADFTYVEDPQYPRLAQALVVGGAGGALTLSESDGGLPGQLASDPDGPIDSIAVAPTHDGLLGVASISKTYDQINNVFANPTLSFIRVKR